MEREIEMEVQPAFIENECTIVFSFRFILEKNHVGEVVIRTCLEQLKKNKPEIKAYCCEMTVLEEYKENSMEKLWRFLKMIGIRRLSNEGCYRIAAKLTKEPFISTKKADLMASS